MGYCINCGQKLDDDAVVCPNCGTPVFGREQESAAMSGQGQEETAEESVLSREPAPEEKSAEETDSASEEEKRESAEQTSSEDGGESTEQTSSEQSGESAEQTPSEESGESTEPVPPEETSKSAGSSSEEETAKSVHPVPQEENSTKSEKFVPEEDRDKSVKAAVQEEKPERPVSGSGQEYHTVTQPQQIRKDPVTQAVTQPQAVKQTQTAKQPQSVKQPQQTVKRTQQTQTSRTSAGKENSPASSGEMSVPRKYRPTTTLGYLGIFVLMLIPGVNLICLIVWACGGCRKEGKRNFARAMLIFWLIIVMIVMVCLIVGFIVLGSDLMLEFWDMILDAFSVFYI